MARIIDIEHGRPATLELLACWVGVPVGASGGGLKRELGPALEPCSVAEATALLHDGLRHDDPDGVASVLWAVVHQDGAAWRRFEERARRRFLRMVMTRHMRRALLVAK